MSDNFGIRGLGIRGFWKPGYSMMIGRNELRMEKIKRIFDL
jgi:hypothetical protein